MRNFYIFSFIFISSIQVCLAQNAKIDSLRTVAANQKADTNRVKTWNSLSAKFKSASLFDSAIVYSEKAILLAHQLSFKTGEAEALTLKGQALAFAGDFKKALSIHFESLKIRQVIGDSSGLAQGYNSIGGCYYDQGNLSEGMSYYLKAMRIYEGIKDEAKVAIILNNMGRIYEDMKQYDKSLECHFKALEMRKKIGDKYRIGASLTNIGNVYFYKEDYKTSLEYHLAALNIREESQDKRGLAISNLNVGNIFSVLKDYPKAISHLEKALKIGEEIKAKDQIAAATNGLGETYRKLKNYTKAIKYSELSFKFAEESGSKKDMKWALLNLSDTYNEAGDPAKAFGYYKQAVVLKDSILNEESAKQINELQTLYETEKKESQIKLLSKDKAINEKELERQKVFRNAILAGAILFLLLLIVIFKRYREKQKANLILDEKNKTIEMQKRAVEEKQKEILDSINYAKRIQTALLPTEKYIARKLGRSKED